MKKEKEKKTKIKSIIIKKCKQNLATCVAIQTKEKY